MLEFDFSAETEDKRDKGYTCPCCGLFVKRYTRTFNSNMAIALIALYRYSENKFVHLEEFLQKHGYQRCGDAAYLVHYGFLEKKLGEREDGSKRNGHYKLTGRGLMFVEGKIKANKNFLIFNNKCEGFKGDMIDIFGALGNKFNYNQLMGINEPAKDNNN